MDSVSEEELEAARTLTLLAQTAPAKSGIDRILASLSPAARQEMSELKVEAVEKLRHHFVSAAQQRELSRLNDWNGAGRQDGGVGIATLRHRSKQACAVTHR